MHDCMAHLRKIQQSQQSGPIWYPMERWGGAGVAVVVRHTPASGAMCTRALVAKIPVLKGLVRVFKTGFFNETFFGNILLLSEVLMICKLGRSDMFEEDNGSQKIDHLTSPDIGVVPNSDSILVAPLATFRKYTRRL